MAIKKTKAITVKAKKTKGSLPAAQSPVTININPPAVAEAVSGLEETFDINVEALEGILGRALKSSEIPVVDQDEGVCRVGKFSVPLERVIRGSVKIEDDMAFPVEAYAVVKDENDPDTWGLRLWETPTKRVTRESVSAVIKGFSDHREDLADDSTRERVADALRTTFPTMYTSSLPPVLKNTLTATKKGATSSLPPLAANLKNESDSQGEYFVLPFKGVQKGFSKLRNVEMGDGVVAVAGKNSIDGDVQVAELHFIGKSKAEVEAFLTKHDLSSWVEQSWSDIGTEWETSGYKYMPVTKNDEGDDIWPYVVHAVATDLPTEVAKSDLSAEELQGLGYDVDYILRLGSDSRFDGYWGWKLKSNPVLLAKGENTFGSLRIGKSELLKRTDDHIVKNGDESTKFMTVGRGEYTLIYATPNRVFLGFEGDMDGIYRVSGSGDYWSLDAVSSYDLPELDGLMSELFSEGAEYLLYAKDARGGGVGQHIIDVTKSAKHFFSYRVLKSTPEQRYTLGVAYPSDSVDVHGEYMTKDQLERTAWDYVRKSRCIGLDHADGTDGAGEVVESYIYRGPDWKTGIFDSKDVEMVIKSGDWMVGTLWEETPWESIKKGDRNGYSMQGWARS